MRAGRLNRLITLQQESETEPTDNLNTPVVEWQDVVRVWASVEPLRGREYLETKNVNPELSVRVRIRYLEGVSRKMRVKYGERIFNIESVIDVEEQHREMELMCSEVFPDG
jgi:SPP1 family predicted phage head-tail adaptor